MVVLTHRNPYARPSDHHSPPRVCAAPRCWCPFATDLQRRTFATHNAGLPAHAACLIGGLMKLAPHITMLTKGLICGERGLPTLLAHSRLHNTCQSCILLSPLLLVGLTAGVAIDPESHTFDSVNCRHVVSHNISTSAS